MARLLSVNVGLPHDIEWKGRTVHTAIWKNPVGGRCRVSRLNLDGDSQGDLAGHGGEQRAVFVYQIESYGFWQEQLNRTDFVYGQFGENFTVEGLSDDTVCIGDRYQIGSALFEVTQPRVTCYRVGIRMDEPRMPALLTSSGRPGFYFRVLQEGEVGGGDEIVKAGEAEGANDRSGDQCAPLFAQSSARSAGAGVANRGSFARMACVVRSSAAEPNQWQRRTRAGTSSASSCTRISASCGDGDRSGIRGCALADHAKRGWTAPRSSSARSVRGRCVFNRQPKGHRCFAVTHYPGRSPRALPNQRESRAQWDSGKLPAGPCSRERCSQCQCAARKLYPAGWRSASSLAQRGNWGDARSGDVALTSGGSVNTADLVAARSSGSGTSSFRRRGSPVDAHAPAWAQLRLLQQARLARQAG